MVLRRRPGARPLVQGKLLVVQRRADLCLKDEHTHTTSANTRSIDALEWLMSAWQGVVARVRQLKDGQKNSELYLIQYDDGDAVMS